jgi:ABC-2 type transport system ATP-binding protein
VSSRPRELTIEVEGLKKRYGTFEAVRGIDVAVGRGEVVGFLGPNGAGKTTTVEIMEGFRSPTEGTVRVLGTDPVTGGRGLRERIGIVLQEAGFLEELTVTETLDAWRRLFPDPLPAGEAIERVGLGSRASVRVKNLSGGEKRRLDFALGTVGRPEVLFLDEPTTGFDPSARRQAWDLVRELVGEGTTVFLTTHYMEEAQALADRVAVIAAGVIVAEGSPDELRAGEGNGVISFRLPAGVAPADLPTLDGAEVTVEDERVSVRAGALTEPLHRLTGWALGRGVELEALSVVRPSLEDVYLDLVREQPEDGA